MLKIYNEITPDLKRQWVDLEKKSIYFSIPKIRMDRKLHI